MIPPGEHQTPSAQTLIYGRALRDALPDVMERHWVGQAILATNTSLSQPGGAADTVMDILGDAAETLVTGVREGAPRADVVRIAATLRGRGTEALVALGGGSVMDAAKAARICLTNNVGTSAAMDRLRTATTAASPRPYLIAIPTTLSGAAYTPSAIILDEASGRTDRFFHQDLAADVVLLDPAVTLATPSQRWLASGIGALAHAIEAWCSPVATPYGDACAIYATRMLFQGLPACHRSPDDVDARLCCQIGARFAVQGLATGVPPGATCGLAADVATVAGVAPGLASCVLLPRLVRLDAAEAGGRQEELASTLPGDGALADRLADLIAQLGLPTRLRDLGVAEAAVPAIAASVLARTTVPAIDLLLRSAW